MNIDIQPIGFLFTQAETIPRHYTVSDAEGVIHMELEAIEIYRHQPSYRQRR